MIGDNFLHSEITDEQEIAGTYFADLVVNDIVIVELKAVESLIDQHEIQFVNYLRATNIEVGLLLNFGIEPQYKRSVLSNEFKKHQTKKIIKTS
jgi:GxxExxY protein